MGWDGVTMGGVSVGVGVDVSSRLSHETLESYVYDMRKIRYVRTKDRNTYGKRQSADSPNSNVAGVCLAER
jgi:hypothetical protein